MNRRDFLRASLAAAAGVAMPGVAGAAPAVASMLTLNASCFQLTVLGYCYCGVPPVPCGYLINHWLPVAFVEVIKAPGDTVAGGGGSIVTGTRIAKRHHQAFEARIYEIPDLMRLTVFQNKSLCLCSSNEAKARGMATNTLGGPLGDLIAKGNPACGITDAMLRATINQIVSAVPAGQLKLLYSTEQDRTNWHEGCRDLPISTALGMGPMACGATGVTNQVDSVLGTGLASKIPGNQMCVGSWGGLFPRQMMQQGLSELPGASMAAYRALHIAAFNTKTMPYEVSLSGKLQPVVPVVSDCYRPGASLLQVDTTAVVNPIGTYGFIWWVPVTCCVDFGKAAACGIGG